MKNIFKKNHIIITALAIMIIIAGYLSFTNDDLADKKDAVETEAQNADDYEEFTDAEGTEVADTADSETAKAGDEDMELTEGTDDTTSADASGENSEVASEDKSSETADGEDANELTDISDEDMLADAQEVSDNGELDLEEGVPGEAVLANAASTIDASYFVSNKIEREQIRAKNKAAYLDIINSAEVSKEQKDVAVNSMLELTDIISKENKTEMLLEAKGFDGAIVFMDDGMVDVVVNSEALTDQQLAIIEKVVTDKTGVDVKNININPVVVS
ncbi:MAG: putative rane protein, partial [Firmicutes bacterium]|nr:putative rane protein [Bacillota bacterium]